MNIKNRIEKLEKLHLDTPLGSQSAAAYDWLQTVPTEDLHFMEDCHLSAEFADANRARLTRLEEDFSEYQKQNYTTRK